MVGLGPCSLVTWASRVDPQVPQVNAGWMLVDGELVAQDNSSKATIRNNQY